MPEHLPVSLGKRAEVGAEVTPPTGVCQVSPMILSPKGVTYSAGRSEGVSLRQHKQKKKKIKKKKTKPTPPNQNLTKKKKQKKKKKKKNKKQKPKPIQKKSPKTHVP